MAGLFMPDWFHALGITATIHTVCQTKPGSQRDPENIQQTVNLMLILDDHI